MGCAVCGIRELNAGQHSLCIGQLSVLIMSDDEFAEFMNYKARIRSCFNVVIVNIFGTRKRILFEFKFFEIKFIHFISM